MPDKPCGKLAARVYRTLAARERQEAMQLQELQNNQTVGLESVPAFRGVFWGQSVPDDPVLGALAIVCVSEPGQTGKKKGAATIVAVVHLVPVQRIMR